MKFYDCDSTELYTQARYGNGIILTSEQGQGKLIKSKNICSLRFTFNSFCIEFIAKIKTEWSAKTEEIKVKYPLEIALEIIKNCPMKDDYVDDSEFYFISHEMGCRNYLYIVPKSFAAVKTGKIMDYQKLDKKEPLKMEDLKENDLLLYKDELYFVLKKYKALKIRTKRHVDEDYLNVKLTSEPAIILYSINNYKQKHGGDNHILLTPKTFVKEENEFFKCDHPQYDCSFFESSDWKKRKETILKAISKKEEIQDYLDLQIQINREEELVDDKGYMTVLIQINRDEKFVDEQGNMIVLKSKQKNSFINFYAYFNVFKKNAAYVAVTKDNTKDILKELVKVDELKKNHWMKPEELKIGSHYFNIYGELLTYLGHYYRLKPVVNVHVKNEVYSFSYENIDTVYMFEDRRRGLITVNDVHNYVKKSKGFLNDSCENYQDETLSSVETIDTNENFFRVVNQIKEGLKTGKWEVIKNQKELRFIPSVNSALYNDFSLFHYLNELAYYSKSEEDLLNDTAVLMDNDSFIRFLTKE